MKCSACGHWNRIEVNKLFMEQKFDEPKVRAFIPMYEPLRTETCKKCRAVIAEPKTLIRITRMQRTILDGLKGYFRFEQPMIEKEACIDEVDREILRLLFEAGSPGL